jgi:hypothetical protein
MSLRRLSDRWRNLEERIKATEQVIGTVTIPAINELRYSGRRFFEAWLIADNPETTNEEKEAFHDHIRMAEQYFNNADHDLTDALVSFFSERKTHFIEKYGIAKGTLIYPTIMGWFEQIDRAQEIIRHARGNRHDRMADYSRLEKDLIPGLLERYSQIVYSEVFYVKKERRKAYVLVVERVIVFAAAIGALIVYWDLLWQKALNLIAMMRF